MESPKVSKHFALALCELSPFLLALKPCRMKSSLLFTQFHVLLGLLGAALISSIAMGQDAKSRLKAPAISAMDTASPSPSAGRTPTAAEQRVIDAQKSALQNAANTLCEQIQVEENDLYHRLGFFERPTRLDPSSYASLDEVAQWRSLLQQLKEKGDRVATLYKNLGKNLDAELKDSKVAIDPMIASQFKTILLGAFPWDTINKKSSLFDRYVENHQKLLDFYQKNWGAWQPSGKDGKPIFRTPSLTATYDKLREELVSTGRQLNEEYVAMTK